MLAALSQVLLFCGLNIQISPLKNDVQGKGVIYTLMENDRSMVKFSKLMEPVLMASGKVKKVELLEVKSPSVHENYFQENIEGVSAGKSKLFFDALLSQGFLDGSRQGLTKNPRQYNPLEKFQPSHPFFLEPGIAQLLTELEVKDAATIPIIEELNVLYNQHEITAAMFQSHVLPFFQSQKCFGAENLKSQKMVVQQFRHP